MKRKSVLLLVSILFISLLAGCDSNNNLAIDDWQVNLISYETTNWIDSDISGYGYSPDEDYEWLLINLEITNLKKEGQSINWILDDFNLITEYENTYTLKLAYNDPPGYIDTSYNPQQIKEGFIVFEVPIRTNISKCKLLWDPYEGNKTTFYLDNLTEQ